DETLVAAQPVDRAGVHDRVALAQMGQCGVGDPKIAVHVDVERVQPLLVGDLLGSVHRLLRGDVVDQQIEPAQGLHGLLDHVRAVLGRAQVAWQQRALAPLGLDQLGGPLRVLVLLEIGDGDVGALLREGDRHGPADARVSAGDQRPAVLQQAPALVALHGAARPGPHRGRRPGGFLSLSGLAHRETSLLPRAGPPAGPAPSGGYPRSVALTPPTAGAVRSLPLTGRCRLGVRARGYTARMDGLHVAVTGATGNIGTSLIRKLSGDDRVASVLGIAG